MKEKKQYSAPRYDVVKFDGSIVTANSTKCVLTVIFNAEPGSTDSTCTIEPFWYYDGPSGPINP